MLSPPDWFLLLAPDITAFLCIPCLKRNKPFVLLHSPADIFTIGSTRRRNKRFSPVTVLARLPALVPPGRWPKHQTAHEHQHTKTSSAPSHENLPHPLLEGGHSGGSGLARLPASRPGGSCTGISGRTSRKTKLKASTQIKPYWGSLSIKQARYLKI